MSENKIIRRLSAVGILGNILLSAFKLLAGLLGSSGAMVSDAVHSLSDVFATALAQLGSVLSRRAPDARHPYGHERFECLASLALGLILGGTGLAIGCRGIQTILSGADVPVPGLLPLIAAVVSIVTKEAMYHYTMYYARKLDSAVFKADAWHHRSDALSSVGSLLGIGAARLGYPIMDPIASLLICACILKVAYDILRDAVAKLLDTACDPAFEAEISALVRSDPAVQQLDLLQTRMFSNKVYADIEISVDRDSSLIEAHAVAERVHDAVEKAFPAIKHVTVHVNPGK